LKATRSTLPYLIAAAGGALLFLSLFLSWVDVGGATASAWDTFDVVDFVLALIGLAAAAIAGSRALGNELPVPFLRPALLKWLGVISLTIVLTYLLEGSNHGFGAFVGLVATIAILGGAILAERPDLASRLADATGVPDDTRPAASPPTGLGAGSSSAAPPAGQPTASGPAAGAAPAAARSEPATAAQPTAGVGGAAVGGAGLGGAGLGAGAGAGAAGVPGAGAGGAPAASQPAQSSGPPPGWYPDPQGQARLRYWDGNAWTEQTSA
jgi:hypothetical protein